MASPGATVSHRQQTTSHYRQRCRRDGGIAAVDVMPALGNDQAGIVPGHGNLSIKAGLIAYRAMLIAARNSCAWFFRATFVCGRLAESRTIGRRGF